MLSMFRLRVETKKERKKEREVGHSLEIDRPQYKGRHMYEKPKKKKKNNSSNFTNNTYEWIIFIDQAMH